MGRGRQGSGVKAHGDKILVRFTHNGKRYEEPLDLKPTGPNMKAAAKIAADVRVKIAAGIFDHAVTFPNSRHVTRTVKVVETLEDYAKVWLGTLLGEKSTLLGYKAQINKFWLKVMVKEGGADVALGSLPLAAVKHTHIASAVAAKAAEGASGKTTNNMLIPIRALFEAAEADGKITVSPVARVHNRKHQRKEIDPFEPEEMQRISAHMGERYPTVIANFYAFAFCTGMRTSELIALRWGDIDWNRKTAHVRRAQVRHETKGTKTHRERNVDLNSLAMAALMSQKAFTFMRGPNELIFCSPEGEPWLSERKLREAWFLPCLKALGIRHRPAYNTRHTYATVALMAGLNPAYIARQLGHANTAMLFKHYAKWIEGADSGAEARKLEGAFGTNLGHQKQDAN